MSVLLINKQRYLHKHAKKVDSIHFILSYNDHKSYYTLSFNRFVSSTAEKNATFILMLSKYFAQRSLKTQIHKVVSVFSMQTLHLHYNNACVQNIMTTLAMQKYTA